MSGFAERIVGLQLGPYQVRRLIARGGMGIVYEGYQPSLDRIVAIKVLYPHLSDDPAFVERFQREARAVARLNHPHIVRMIDYGSDQGYQFMVMDYVSGGSLRQALTDEQGRRARLPIAESMTVMAQIGSALGWAHRRGYVHRDVKPGNILLDEDGIAKLSDFGLVKMLDSRNVTMTGGIVGTPEYMAPEQTDSTRPIGPAADQYSLAVVAYELLVGQSPFSAPTPAAMIQKHVYETPPSLRHFDPSIAPEVDLVLTRALAKDPEQRYPSVDEFVRVLVGAVGAGPAEGVRPPLAGEAGSGLTPTPVWDDAAGPIAAGAAMSPTMPGERLAPYTEPPVAPPSEPGAGATPASVSSGASQPPSTAEPAVATSGASSAPPLPPTAVAAGAAGAAASPGGRSRTPLLVAAALAGVVLVGAIAWFGFLSGNGDNGGGSSTPTAVGQIGVPVSTTPATPEGESTATPADEPSATVTTASVAPTATFGSIAATPSAQLGPTATSVVVSRPVAATPTVMEIPVGEGDTTTIAQATFDDGDAAGFFVGSNEFGNSAAVQDGNYILTAASQAWQTFGQQATANLGDGVIVASAQLQGNGKVGVSARAFTFDDGSFTLYTCWLQSNSQAGCSLYSGDAWTDLFRIDVPNIALADYHTYSLGIVGTTLTFQLDDTNVGSATLNADIASTGYWGFYTESIDGDVNGRFDSVIIARVNS